MNKNNKKSYCFKGTIFENALACKINGEAAIVRKIRDAKETKRSWWLEYYCAVYQDIFTGVYYSEYPYDEFINPELIYFYKDIKNQEVADITDVMPLSSVLSEEDFDENMKLKANINPVTLVKRIK